MWLWFNKSTGDQPNTGVIDLENFKRGRKEGQPDKGQILYSAKITEKPGFEQFSRIVNSSNEAFFGFFGNSTPQTNDDLYYIRKAESLKRQSGGRRLQPEMITKWRLTTSATITDGDAGRAADIFQKDPVILNVLSTGTVATFWEEHQRQVEVRDNDGKVTGTRTETYIVKEEQEWVDRVEYRLVFRGQLWAEWAVEGDARWDGQTDATINSPFFDTYMKGGFFKPTVNVITTKPGVDPAFAMILSHLCTTEYSVAEIKRDLTANTPDNPPQTFNWGLGGRSPAYTPPQPVSITITFQPRWG